MSMAGQFKILVEKNLEDSEWYDGEEEYAQSANMRIANHFFQPQISPDGQFYHFSDGSSAKTKGLSVEIWKPDM